MAHFATNAGDLRLRDTRPTSNESVDGHPRPMHKFLQEWRVITRHPELDRVRRKETDWSVSLDGRLS